MVARRESNGKVSGKASCSRDFAAQLTVLAGIRALYTQGLGEERPEKQRMSRLALHFYPRKGMKNILQVGKVPVERIPLMF